MQLDVHKLEGNLSDINVLIVRSVVIMFMEYLGVVFSRTGSFSKTEKTPM